MGGNVSLGVGFGVLKAQARPSVSLPPACISRYGTLRYHICLGITMVPAMMIMDCKPTSTNCESSQH